MLDLTRLTASEPWESDDLVIIQSLDTPYLKYETARFACDLGQKTFLRVTGMSVNLNRSKIQCVPEHVGDWHVVCEEMRSVNPVGRVQVIQDLVQRWRFRDEYTVFHLESLQTKDTDSRRIWLNFVLTSRPENFRSP
jgi:hypothetical protein